MIRYLIADILISYINMKEIKLSIQLNLFFVGGHKNYLVFADEKTMKSPI